MEASGLAPASELAGFVEEVVAWTHPIANAYLDDEQVLLLERARAEIEGSQLREFRERIQAAKPESFEEAGFTKAQTAFKLDAARRGMSATARTAESPRPALKKKLLAALDFVVENIRTILGSLSFLSKWIEAASELLGVLVSGVKATVAEKGFFRVNGRKARRFFRSRREERKRKREERKKKSDDASSPPASASA